jgi:hypothetical protein
MSASEPEPLPEEEHAAEDVMATPTDVDRNRPERLVRTCVATMADSKAFGPMVAAEAQSRGFYQTSRQAFVADGQHYNWRIQKAWFPHAEPIADFLHVLCYLFEAAYALDKDASAKWSQFEAWMTACWQGRVDEVLAELKLWREPLGPVSEERSAAQSAAPESSSLVRAPPDPEQHQRQMLDEAISYLTNNRTRMNYPCYRQQGLPVTSSLVESLVGEFNSRVKGKDKYWDRAGDRDRSAGSESILQVRAAVLSEDNRLGRFFANRPGNPYRRRVVKCTKIA